MSDDWLGGDPFADPDDPAAADRERRRREREDRRRQRDEKHAAQEAVTPPPSSDLPSPPPRNPERDFWDEEPGAAPPSPESPSGLRSAQGGAGGEQSDGGKRRGRRRTVVAILVAATLAGAVAAVAAYRHFDREAPPPVVLKTITVTVPEGYSREQAAAVAAEVGLAGSYLKASRRSRYLEPASYGGVGAKSLEGFLFPDTFELEKRAPASDLVQLQLQDFKRRIKGVDMRYARSKNLTTYDVVTIASMVEEEAQLEGERRLIAAVIYNRLREGIPLGIDATVRFATGNYEAPLTESELAVDSPYNTRLNAGLPPGPISSPGLASIEAVAHPAKVDYLYYVVEPGTCGRHAFSSSEVEFQADVARYNEAREAAGGESPDTCD